MVTHEGLLPCQKITVQQNQRVRPHTALTRARTVADSQSLLTTHLQSPTLPSSGYTERRTIGVQLVDLFRQ